jgi:hypothetical protein
MDDCLVLDGVSPHMVFAIRNREEQKFLIEGKILTKPIGKELMLKRLHAGYQNLTRIKLLYLIPQKDGTTVEHWKIIFESET